MVAAVAVLQKISLVLAMIGLVSKSAFGNTGCMPQEIYDIKFEYRHKCSMTVFWTTPNQQCAYNVARYIVQSAQGCPSGWKNHGTLVGNVTSLSIDDIALVTSCLLGKCYIRVIAEFDRPDQSERKYSHCVGLADDFYASSITSTRHYNIIGQQVCFPIRTRCSGSDDFGVPPLFIINQRTGIPLSTVHVGQTSAYEYYLNFQNGPELCISNNSDSNIVVHEICHILNPNCPLCPESSGEIVFISRAEIQSVSNITITEGGSNDNVMTSEEFNCLPSIVTFCASSYMANISDDKSASTVEICICLPLHGLHGPDSDDLIIELSLQDNSTFPGTDAFNGSVDAVVTLNPNSTQPQCIVIELPMQNIQYADNNTSFNICLTLLNDSAKCVHIPESCTGIKFDNTTIDTNRDALPSTTSETMVTTLGTIIRTQKGDSIIIIIIVAVIVPAVVIIGMIIIIAIIICKVRKRYWSFSPKSIKKPEEPKENIKMKNIPSTE